MGETWSTTEKHRQHVNFMQKILGLSNYLAVRNCAPVQLTSPLIYAQPLNKTVTIYLNMLASTSAYIRKQLYEYQNKDSCSILYFITCWITVSQTLFYRYWNKCKCIWKCRCTDNAARATAEAETAGAQPRAHWVNTDPGSRDYSNPFNKAWEADTGRGRDSPAGFIHTHFTGTMLYYQKHTHAPTSEEGNQTNQIHHMVCVCACVCEGGWDRVTSDLEGTKGWP